MMGGGRRLYAGAALGSCDGEGGECVEWVKKYMGDCVCNVRDAISFGVGLASVFCWGVAEVPQIITNFREGSTEGMSLIFLMTWVVGDGFNLVGCYLEPSTLPTQFYMAVLYTITTLVLVGQVIYYQHILKWRKARMATLAPRPIKEQDEANRIETKPVLPQAPSSQPIAYAPSPPSSAPVYYMSARSLARSRTPTPGSYLVTGSRGSGGRDSSNYLLPQNSLEHLHGSHPIPISINTSRSAPAPMNAGASPSILRAVVSIAMCVGGLNIGRGLTMKHNSEMILHASSIPRVFTGRKLFQSELHTRIFSGALHQKIDSEESIGEVFGWLMAAIYMGGRLPQIWLNIKRGSVEGLNPLMFTFALLGNVTYVGSILIRSTKWTNIKSNMPWLVDAGVCVVLDCFILCQFIYYLAWKQRDAKDDSGGDYKSLE